MRHASHRVQLRSQLALPTCELSCELSCTSRTRLPHGPPAPARCPPTLFYCACVHLPASQSTLIALPTALPIALPIALLVALMARLALHAALAQSPQRTLTAAKRPGHPPPLPLWPDTCPHLTTLTNPPPCSVLCSTARSLCRAGRRSCRPFMTIKAAHSAPVESPETFPTRAERGK